MKSSSICKIQTVLDFKRLKAVEKSRRKSRNKRIHYKSPEIVRSQSNLKGYFSIFVLSSITASKTFIGTATVFASLEFDDRFVLLEYDPSKLKYPDLL